jgi:mRNA interferase MazF
MTAHRVGDVVSVEFPFSDLQASKRRPGLVLAGGDDDLLVARLTTSPPRDGSDVALVRWAEIGLPRASTIRLIKLATIDYRLVHHMIGRLRPEDAAAVAHAWQNLATTVSAELQK